MKKDELPALVTRLSAHYSEVIVYKAMLAKSENQQTPLSRLATTYGSKVVSRVSYKLAQSLFLVAQIQPENAADHLERACYYCGITAKNGFGGNSQNKGDQRAAQLLGRITHNHTFRTLDRTTRAVILSQGAINAPAGSETAQRMRSLCTTITVQTRNGSPISPDKTDNQRHFRAPHEVDGPQAQPQNSVLTPAL